DRDQRVHGAPAYRMNARTAPIRASTSVKAMPRIMVVCRRFAISGWRAWPSTVLPTMKPMPMPGPIVDRPYPIRLTLPPTPAAAARIAATRCIPSPFSLMLFAHGQGDVDGGEQREHVRLHRRDEDLEAH